MMNVTFEFKKRIPVSVVTKMARNAPIGLCESIQMVNLLVDLCGTFLGRETAVHNLQYETELICITSIIKSKTAFAY